MAHATTAPTPPAESSPPPTDPGDWVDAYGDYLYRFALSRVHDSHVAEELLQDTFVTALKSLAQYDGRVEVKYWLRGILRHKAVDHIRRQVRERPMADLEAYDEPVSPLRKWFGIAERKVDPWSFDPAVACQQREFWEVFHRCLAELKSPLREIYTLKEIESVSSEEICREFGISANNLWVMVHRARKQLKASLLREWGRA